MWFVSWVVGTCLIAAVLLAQGPITVPDFARTFVVQRLDRAVERAGFTTRVGDLQVTLRDGFTPVAILSDVTLQGNDGAESAKLDQAEVVFDPAAFLSAKTGVSAVRLSGLHFAMSRNEEGQLSLSLGDDVVMGQRMTLGGLVLQVRNILEAPELRRLDHIGIDDVSVEFSDAIDGQVVSTRNGNLRLQRAGEELRLDANLGNIASGAETAGRGGATLTLVSPAADVPATIAAGLRGLVPSELASIGGGALREFLSRVNAPVRLDLAGEIPVDAQLRDMTGTIDVGDGTIDIPSLAVPIAVESARAELAFDADRNSLLLENVRLSSDPLSLAGRISIIVPFGQTNRVVSQIDLDTLRLDPPGLFESPAEFDMAAADIRYRRDSEKMEIDDLVLRQGTATVTGRLRIDGGEGRAAGELSAKRIDAQSIVPLWPVSVAEKTRGWLQRNVLAGTLRDIAVGFDARIGEKPDIGLTFSFEDGEFRPLKGLNHLTGASGKAELANHAFRLVIDQADISDPLDGKIEVKDALIVKKDIRVKGDSLAISFAADGDTAGILALVRSPALRGKASGADQDVDPRTDNFNGTLSLAVDLDVPLRPGTKPADVSYSAEGTLNGFSSDSLMPGKRIEAGELRVTASPEMLDVSGPVRLSGHPMNVRYLRPLGPDAADPGVTASGALTPPLLAEFGVNIPGTRLTGAGHFEADVALPKGSAPAFEVRGSLSGLGIDAQSLGWSKRSSADGTFSVRGQSGPAGGIDRLAVDAPGLDLAGSIAMSSGKVDRISLSRLALGGWLDGSAEIVPGQRIALSGGTIDLRNRPQGAGGGGGLPLDLVLDRLVVTDGISLTGVKGRINGNGGSLTGNINGRAAVRVDLSGTGRDMSIHLTADDAGQVLRAAGVLQQGRGGSLDLRLVPSGQAGHYRGQMRVTNTALRNTPVVAELLSAVSVVGAVEQMAGEGITFDDVRADFNLAPGRLTIDSASASGPSLGLSANGVVDLSHGAMDVEGVVSPIYFLNRAGSFMTRRGEGLVGISYRLTGSMTAPKLNINPLSVFTPGFLRNIFRTNPGARSQGQ